MRRRRRRAETKLLFALALTVGGSVAAALSCLPTLDATPLPRPAPTSVCGDGVTDLTAGEQCDPGDGGAKGCTASCGVSCEDGGFVDPESKNCYWTLPALGTFAQARAGCEERGGHVVAITSEEEARIIANWYVGAEPYWVGLRFEPAQQAFVATSEAPGWAPSGRCAGCFGRFVDAAAYADDSNARCVLAQPDGVRAWYSMSCESAARAVCEREPSGTVAQPCSGSICAELRRTRGAKRYLYVPVDATADEAAAACGALPHGRLVIFESAEEREELLRELARVEELRIADAFWIGLSRGMVPPNGAGGEAPDAWLWDNGTSVGSLYPNPWGDNAPDASGPARAFVTRAAGRYDVHLAVVDEGIRALPYLCQFQ